LRSLALLVIATFVALLLGEVGLRLADQSYYWAYAKRPDAVLGWRPPPEQSGWQRFEGEALIETNKLGFRDRDHPVPKSSGVLRVAVLGDSFTEAVQVPIDDTWWRKMGDRLRHDGCASGTGQRVEVLSFAISGYSTAQSLLAWRAFAKQFAPDVVILAFFIGNDLNENLDALDEEPLRPYLIPTDEGLMLDDGFKRSTAYRDATRVAGRARQWLIEHSRIVQLGLQARDALRVADINSATDRHSDEPQELGVDNAVYRRPTTPEWEAAWVATEAMLAAFANETRAAGAQPILMIIGTGAQVHPNPRGRARFAQALGVDDLGYPVRRLLGTAGTHQMPVINLPALWTGPARQPSQHLHGFPGGRPGFGHWNHLGHAAAGAAAADVLCKLWRPRKAGWLSSQYRDGDALGRAR